MSSLIVGDGDGQHTDRVAGTLRVSFGDTMDEMADDDDRLTCWCSSSYKCATPFLQKRLGEAWMT
jgi:hypothetical protein